MIFTFIAATWRECFFKIRCQTLSKALLEFFRLIIIITDFFFLFSSSASHSLYSSSACFFICFSWQSFHFYHRGDVSFVPLFYSPLSDIEILITCQWVLRKSHFFFSIFRPFHHLILSFLEFRFWVFFFFCFDRIEK